MKKQRKHYTPEEKVAILRRHLLENVPISKLCPLDHHTSVASLPTSKGNDMGASLKCRRHHSTPPRCRNQKRDYQTGQP